MPVPPNPILQAAVRWLERLPESGPSRCRALFTHVSAFSDLTPTQYESALTWLQDKSLLEDLHSPVPARQRIFDAALQFSAAPWLPDADCLVQSPDELPEDVLRAAAGLGISDSHAFERLLSVYGKVDTEQRSRIGEAGETALVELLTAGVNASVVHTAAHSDGYGYDIAVHARQHSLHIELKSTLRRNRILVYLSRNEYETMLRDQAWQLVVLRLGDRLRPVATASVPNQWIIEHVPLDQIGSGRWESCRLDIPPEYIVPGIQRLEPVFTAAAPPLLRGSSGW